MPKDQDEIEQMAPQSSSEVDQDVQEDQPNAEASDADSSPATDEVDTLSVIRDVVGAEDEAAGSSPEGQKVDEQEDEGEQEQEPDNEDYSDVPFNKHPRFRELLAKSKANEADATQFRSIRNFLDTSGLNDEEAAGALQDFALAKSNPAEAWKRIKPWVQDLAMRAGALVPPDLQQRVQAGEITLDMAKELATARAGQTSAEAARQFEQQQAGRQQAQRAQMEINTSVNSWHQERAASDPGFEAKIPALQREIAFMQQQEGKPNTPQGVRNMLDRAYAALTPAAAPQPTPTPTPAAQRTPAPVKKAVKPVTGGQVAGQSRAAPTDTLGIIQNIVGGGS